MNQKKWQMPDTYVIIFFIVVLAALLTWVVPMGKFDIAYEVVNANDVVISTVADGEVVEVTAGDKSYTIDATDDSRVYVFDGEEELGNTKKEKAKAIEIGDFKVIQVYGKYITDGETSNIKIFEKWGGVGFLNYVFEGFVSGDKWGSAVGVMAFILIVGGSFGIVLKTGAVENGILNMIKYTKGYEILIIPIMFILFSAGGAVFGMGEEAIPFALILVPVMIELGYDAITGVMITYVATQIGFAASWMNPFSVVIAQGIAGVSVGQGQFFRMSMWAFFTLLGIAFTMWYATKIKKNPESSLTYESDHYFRNDYKEKADKNTKFGFGHVLVLLTVLAGLIWIIWGVNEYEYYLPEIASIFFTMGLVAGIIGVIFKLEGMKINDIASSFRTGASDLLGAAMVVGMAKGIVLVLGGTGAGQMTVMNTILNGMANTLTGLPAMMIAWVMYVFQSIFNFFVVSGSGQAAITMPLMAPLASIVGVSKDVSVLAFQLGDGFTNLIVPTSASLMGCLGVARIEWTKWFKFQIKFQGILFVCATLFIVLGVVTGL
jgi:uncharacterized ion transporter superfamily protein YfcC